MNNIYSGYIIFKDIHGFNKESWIFNRGGSKYSLSTSTLPAPSRAQELKSSRPLFSFPLPITALGHLFDATAHEASNGEMDK